MEQSVAVALAHFLALLVPGVDFFLIARTAVAGGWRRASGVCAGIATANGLLIAATFTGMALVSHPALVGILQAAGGCFLIWVGTAFLRSPTAVELPGVAGEDGASWRHSFGLGLASGLLNPKNLLFYASLASALAGATTLRLAGYGIWMVTVVLLWDLLVAALLGNTAAIAALARALPWLSRIAGIFLIVFGLALIAGLGVGLLS